MRISLICALAVLLSAGIAAEAQEFTLEQALSAPYASTLVASRTKNRFAWVENQEGKRNLWLAERQEGGRFKTRQLTHYDKDDGQDIYQIAWTPNAEQLVYVRGGDEEYPSSSVPNPTLNPEGTEQSIWLISTAEGAPRKLSQGYSPVVSPKGDQLAFLLQEQIYVVDLRDPQSQPKQLLHTRGEISSLVWAPDGHALAFVSERPSHSFIGVFDFEADQLVYLDPSTDEDAYPTWSPDSRQIAFIRTSSHPNGGWMEDRRTDSPWSLRIADSATGKGRIVWQAKQGRGSAYYEISGTQLFWTKDNLLVFPWEGDGWCHLYSIPVVGGTPALLTPGEFEVDDPILRNDGKTILYTSNQGDIDRRHIWKVSVSGGNPEELTPGTGIEVQPVEANGTIAMLRADEHTPLRPAWIQANGKLQDFVPELIPAAYPGAKFVTPQQVLFPAKDGLPLHGQLFLPSTANDGKQHPALVFFHGGSQRQMLLGFHAMRYYSNAYAMNQYLASRGYIVLSVNYRSGTGYGLNFREALHYGRGGASEYNDVLGAGTYLRSRRDVDPARIGAWGGSYGGFMTALALARASDIFAAGVDMHGVHEWMPPSVWKAKPIPGANDAALQSAWDSSPVSSMSTWKSPVLLIHGDDDRNVPFFQTVLLASLLRKYGVEYEELIFPDELHGFLLHRSWVTAYKAEADFFERHLMNLPVAKAK